MTNKEKQLLLKDLCARLPYGIIVHIHDIDVDDYDRQLIGEDLDFVELDRRNLKPYLRSISNMTEEEVKTYRTLNIVNAFLYVDNGASLDYLNSIHIDYRGLIPLGLALEAPEGMYKTE